MQLIGGVIITDAIKYVQGQMDQLNNQERKLLKEIKDKEGKAEESANGNIETINGVF